MSKRVIKSLFVLVVLGVAVSAIYMRQPALSEGAVINIGSISALTGIGVAPGEEERNGARLAVEEINAQGGIDGRQLALVEGDLSLDKMKNASLVVSKLIDVDKVVAIVGAQWDEPTEAIIPLIEAAKIPTISPDATNHVEIDRDAPYFFSTWYDNRVGIRTILAYANQHNLKKIYIIRPVNGGFWKFTADLITEYAPQYGVTIIGDMDLGNPLITDFRTPIAKVRQSNPDAVFIVETDPAQCVFAKQARELGLTVPILATEAAGNYNSLSTCARDLETSYFSTPKHSTEYQKFENVYAARYGHVPQYPSAVTAYDAVFVIARGLEKTKGKGGQTLRDAIAETKDMKGAALSRISFDQKGYLITPDDAFEMQTVRGGKFVKAE
ncbi:MAG: ABC transporter substrate-binding protein [Candidatus Taylorbacteria bacterium]|nr:ABC transporter substrate-binding protein [Candidatus Taylorbacteria bacterium]